MSASEGEIACYSVASPDELRARWADAGQRDDIIQHLAERGIDFPTVAALANKPNVDPFDPLVVGTTAKKWTEGQGFVFCTGSGVAIILKATKWL